MDAPTLYGVSFGVKYQYDSKHMQCSFVFSYFCCCLVSKINFFLDHMKKKDVCYISISMLRVHLPISTHNMGLIKFLLKIKPN